MIEYKHEVISRYEDIDELLNDLICWGKECKDCPMQKYLNVKDNGCVDCYNFMKDLAKRAKETKILK